MNTSYHLFVENSDIIVDLNENKVRDSSIRYIHEINDDTNLDEYIDIIKSVCLNSNKLENYPKEKIGLIINYYNNKTNIKIKFYPFDNSKSKNVKIKKLKIKMNDNEILVPLVCLKKFKTNSLDKNFEYNSLGEFRKAIFKVSKTLIEESFRVLL